MNGYTILITILILTAVGLLIIMTINFLGIDETRRVLAQRDSSLGLYLSTACAEEALLLVRDRPTYTTSGRTMTIDEARGYRCWYEVINRNPPKYIYAESRVANFNFPRKLEIRVDKVTPKIKIGYWLEQ